MTADGDPARPPVPVAPSLTYELHNIAPAQRQPLEDLGRLVRMSLFAVGVAFLAGIAAQLLIALIGFITNLAFYGRFSFEFVSPANNHLGLGVLVVPVIGGLIVGAMARFGSTAIRGHGIPEAMEQVLINESRIPARVSILKPVSAAISIGTGGPFGAEGPIIATGGALGSLCGQLLRTTADERKVLLAAGAAAGMTATFGSPVAAVLLAVELLLFEYRARSLIPVSLASATATGVRIAFQGSAPVFPMPSVPAPGGEALVAYILLGALSGLVAAGITRSLYGVEDLFERSRIHWMWWPALGALAVGLIGWFSPHTLGVGYDNIQDVLGGTIVIHTLIALVVLKFVSWAIALGSGTSGGTLAPIFTIGGGFGAIIGTIVARIDPSLGIDPHVAALVGMAAVFAGASHALLASVVFAFETTRQAMSLLPLLGGCSAAYLVALGITRTSIMTERLARRGHVVSPDYAMDTLALVTATALMTPKPVTLRASDFVEDVRDGMASGKPEFQHQGYPVTNDDGRLVGVVTRRDLLQLDLSYTATVGDLIKRPPVVVFADASGREAADHMVREGVGRLPVVGREDPSRVLGLLTRTDLLSADENRLEALDRSERSLDFRLRMIRQTATGHSETPP